MGVFATRSPFRPNAIGLSSVRLLDVQLHSSEGPLLRVSGADLKDGTPIFDIKPYIPYTDSHPDAKSGFAPMAPVKRLEVVCDDAVFTKIPTEMREALRETLSLDPRPSYHNDPERVYGMTFFGKNVSFKISENDILTVVEIF